MFLCYISGKGSIIPPTGPLNDNQWHKVEIQRTGRRIKVSIDDGRVAGEVKFCLDLIMSQTVRGNLGLDANGLLLNSSEQ